MKVAYVTAGAAGMFCGSCMRDNTLVRTLRERGSDVVLVPTFTPIRVDEEDASLDRVFLGGIDVYLQQRAPLYRRLPRTMTRWLDHPRLLRGVSRMALERRRSDDGKLAISLLRGTAGHHARAIEDLVSWLAGDLRPDLVNVSNLLIAGFVPRLRQQLDVPVLVTLQGDDIFLDALPEPERTGVLNEMRRVASAVDGFIVFTDSYRDHMAALLGVPTDRFHRVRLGLADPEAFARKEPTPARPPTLGYLARICPEKGFDLLVDAFVRLRAMPETADAELRVGGWLGSGDRGFFEQQMSKLARSRSSAAFTYVPLPDRDAKVRFLHGLDVFSVPTARPEPKGLFVLEALAAGVPAVLPNHGSFPELARETGGVKLVRPADAEALALAIHALLRDPDERRRLGEEGQRGVLDHSSAEHAARDTLAVWERYPKAISRARSP